MELFLLKNKISTAQKKQTCDGSAKAFLTYPARSFPYQVLHITVKGTPEIASNRVVCISKMKYDGFASDLAKNKP